MTWSAGLSREAAISSGRRSCLRPSIVAWATLMPLEDPRDFAMMSFTPAISRMARGAPPAASPAAPAGGVSRDRPGAGAAGDDAGARRGGLHEYAAGARGAEDRVDDRRAGEGYVEEVLARLFDALLHRESRLLGLRSEEHTSELQSL